MSTSTHETPEAIERAFREHASFVFRMVRYFGVADANVEDAVQDVFIVAHRRWDSFDSSRPLRPWLAGIARRVAAGLRRKASERLVDQLDGEPTSDGVRPDEQFLREQAVEFLHHFLQSIDEDRRTVFALVEVEEMTVPEVSEIVDANLNTVYSRLRSARKAFDRALKRREAQEEGCESRRNLLALEKQSSNEVACDLGSTS